MISKIKSYYYRIPWQSLKDPKTLGQLGFLVIVLLVSWSGVKTIQSNYQLEKQIAALSQQNQVAALENSNQGLQNQYYSSNQYQELSARQELGLGQLGETELIVPKSVALAHLANLPTPSMATTSTKPEPKYLQNFKSWIDFFLHRPNSSSGDLVQIPPVHIGL